MKSVTIKLKHLKLKLNHICTTMVAAIIAMNAIRYLLNIQESNILIYGIYGMYIAVSLILYKRNYKNFKFLKNIPFLFTIFLIYGIFTALIGRFSDLLNAIKLILVFLTSISFFLMDIKDIRLSINLSYFFLIFYVFFLISKPDRINLYLSHGSNYLILSLPIGLLLAMMLSRIIFQIYNKTEDMIEIPVEIVISLLAFVALAKITGRGSIIFPFFTAVVNIFLLDNKRLFKKIILILLLVLTMHFAYEYFLNNASGYVLSHVLKLLDDTTNEDRWIIWKKTIDFICSDFHWLLGGGIGATVRELGFYPHNIYLQCIAEFGLLGAVTILYITLYTLKIQLKTIKKPFNNNDMLLFVELSSGAFYLILNFMKSFPMYDSVVLMIMTFGIISIYCQLKKESFY